MLYVSYIKDLPLFAASEAIATSVWVLFSILDYNIDSILSMGNIIESRIAYTGPVLNDVAAFYTPHCYVPLNKLCPFALGTFRVLNGL